MLSGEFQKGMNKMPYYYYWDWTYLLIIPGCRGALRRGQSSRHHCRNTGRGRGGFSRSGFRGDDKLPHPQQQKRRQARKKDRTSHMLHRASSLLPKNEICPLHE